MKKILCFLLTILMILSVVACDTTKDPVDSSDTGASDSVEAIDTVDTTEKVNTNVIPAEKYNGVFKAGYARAVITPELPAPVDGTMDDQIMTKVRDDMYATCIAFNDGENTALIYTVDVKNIGPVSYSSIKLRISIATKVPKENIILSATHSHSAFTPIDNLSKSTSESLKKWSSNLPGVMADIAKEAIADMEDAEIYVGRANTPNMAFVRRYLHADGTYSIKSTVPGLKSTTPIVGHAAEADDILQIIRLVRAEKKDIVMTNWQGHLAAARDVIPSSVTADLAFYVRDGVESNDDDVLVAYFQGASGNLNLYSPIITLQKYKNYVEVGKALANTVLETMPVEKLTKLEAGEIKGVGTTFEAARRKHSAERVKQAEEVMALEQGSDEQKALMAKYGFESLYAPKSIIGSTKESGYREFALSAISFGDLGFIGAPYEMFDDNGVQIKESSPYSMTFILTCAGGYWGYVPSEMYYTTYGGYEYEVTDFAMGVAEKAVAEFVRMLKELKGIA